MDLLSDNERVTKSHTIPVWKLCAVQSQERKNWQISLEFDVLQFAKFLLKEYYILGKKIEEIVYEI